MEPFFSWRAISTGRRCIGLVNLASLLILGVGPLAAQQRDQPQVPQESISQGYSQRQARAVDDPTVPRGAMRSFVHACRGGDWTQASSFLDLSGQASDPANAAKLAWQLKVVLDRGLPIPFELLSQQPAGDLEDGLPPGVDRLGKVGAVEILLEKELQEGRWRFAPSTVAAIPQLYQSLGYGVLGEYLPAPMFEISFLDLQLWQWTGLLLVALLALLAATVIAWVVHRIARGLAARTTNTLDDRLVDRMALPFRLLVALALFTAGTTALALTIRANDFIDGAALGLTVLIVTWLVLRTIDIFSTILKEQLEANGRVSAVAVLPLARRALKTFLLFIALIALLQNIGFNVTGLIAGLGVGGLAIALAAQKSIANLFGGVSLIADQPILVGDFCRFGDGKVGTVEEIGMRSTRVRTPDRTLISIPNAEFSEMQLENFGARDRIRIFAVLGLRYETTPDQLRHVLAAMRSLLIAHPMISEAPARVRFIGFGAHSLDLELFAYVETKDWNVFLQVREDVFLRLMDIVSESGSGFAFPSQTLYLGRDGGLDGERARAAEAQVRAWRERNELPFPEFSQAGIDALDGTADYPPVGSAVPVDPAAGGETR